MDRIPLQAKDEWSKCRQKRRSNNSSVLFPNQEEMLLNGDTAGSPIVRDDIDDGGSGLRKSRRPV
jgi:hypothetical protein